MPDFYFFTNGRWKAPLVVFVMVLCAFSVNWYSHLETRHSRRRASQYVNELIDRASSNPADSRSTMQLLEMAKGSARFKACIATVGLGKIGDAAIPIIPEIAALMESPDLCVSQEAAKSLGRLGTRSAPALPALERYVKKRPTDATTWFAVQAIGEIGERASGSLPLLREMVGSEPEMFKGAVAEAISKISEKQSEATSDSAMPPE